MGEADSQNLLIITTSLGRLNKLNRSVDDEFDCDLSELGSINPTKAFSILRDFAANDPGAEVASTATEGVIPDVTVEPAYVIVSVWRRFRGLRSRDAPATREVLAFQVEPTAQVS